MRSKSDFMGHSSYLNPPSNPNVYKRLPSRIPKVMIFIVSIYLGSRSIPLEWLPPTQSWPRWLLKGSWICPEAELITLIGLLRELPYHIKATCHFTKVAWPLGEQVKSCSYTIGRVEPSCCHVSRESLLVETLAAGSKHFRSSASANHVPPF